MRDYSAWGKPLRIIISSEGIERKEDLSKGIAMHERFIRNLLSKYLPRHIPESLLRGKCALHPHSNWCNFNIQYRVGMVVSYLDLVEHDLGVPPSCPTDQPILPNFHLPQQDWADSGMSNTKSIQPSNQPPSPPCINYWNRALLFSQIMISSEPPWWKRNWATYRAPK